MPFRIVEHTADVGIEAWGSDAGACLADAGAGLTALLTGRDDPHTLRPDRAVELHVEAPDLPALAVAFLSELLWRVESEDELWLGGGAEVGTTGQGLHEVRAAGNAVAYDPERHGRGVEVKAVTYHGLEFGPEAHGWRLKVLLDI